MAKPPKVKRYKATLEGWYAGRQYEASVVTYGKTKKETKERLEELLEAESPDPEKKLYTGYYKTREGVGIPARMSITRMQKVEQEYRVVRRDVIKSYTRIVKGKKQRVSGYTREYREYYVPPDEADLEPIPATRIPS